MVTDAKSSEELESIKATKLATSDSPVINTGKRTRGKKAKEA